jgi:branched-subunit amino acid permease
MDWLAGVLMIYAFLFGVGNIIFGRTWLGLILLLAGLVFGGIIYADLNKRGWETIGK